MIIKHERHGAVREMQVDREPNGAIEATIVLRREPNGFLRLNGYPVGHDVENLFVLLAECAASALSRSRRVKQAPAEGALVAAD
jgi:hypothetical protein